MKRIIFVAMLLAVAACEKKQETSEVLPPATLPPETTQTTLPPMPMTTDTPAETTTTSDTGATTTQQSSGAPGTDQSAGTDLPSAATGAGDYTVNAGDTLAGIARQHNLDYRDLARWNSIQNPDRISKGQTLRLTEP